MSTNTAYVPSSESDKTEEKKLFKGMISCEMQVTEHFVRFCSCYMRHRD